MNKKIKYTKMPRDVEKAFDRSVRIADFLPSPDKLVLKEDTVKVTLALTKESVDFFKSQAKAQKVPYQRMIKSLVDHYVQGFSKG